MGYLTIFSIIVVFLSAYLFNNEAITEPNTCSLDDRAGCADDTVTISDIQYADLPIITLAVFIEKPTPFLQEFFEKLTSQRYPRTKMHLFLHNNETYHDQQVNDFLDKQGSSFISSSILHSSDTVDERMARNRAIEYCIQKLCKYLFVIDSDVHLSNPSTIIALIQTNKSIVAPMLNRPDTLWSNFWGAISDNGFYARSDNYVEIVQNQQTGLWNVPYISSSYLIKSEILNELINAYSNDMSIEADMSFAKMCREKEFSMFVDNLDPFGHLINSDTFNVSLTHPEMYQLLDNRLDWEAKYLHEDYKSALKQEYTTEQPCTDVYWYPQFSPLFCQHMIEIMETYGKWSSGKHEDDRLEGGYESVPTTDIHMSQVGLEPHWLDIVDEYIRPIQEKIFIGYYTGPPKVGVAFVARYRPDEQPSLRPHHDESTYTINLALNRPRLDYEGGGARFIRYNCSVVDTRVGWGLLHPGRLTHYHEGLPTTKGTRYIMISFLDP